MLLGFRMIITIVRLGLEADLQLLRYNRQLNASYERYRPA